MRDPTILFGGACAYALRSKGGYEVRVYSSNGVQHVAAGEAPDAERAERVCRRLNAYPRQTRAYHGLL
jgi:hypothetical protein